MGKIFLNNIAEELAAKSDIANSAADDFLRLFIETIEKGLKEDGIVKIKGLGTFKLTVMGERSSVDVNTGERILIKGHTKVAFTPDSTMKELINRPFAHFEPTELNDGFPTDENPMESEDETEETEYVEEAETVEAVKDVAETVEEISQEVKTEEIVEEVMPVESPTDEHTETVAQESIEESSEQSIEDSVVEVTQESEVHTDDAEQLPQAENVAGDEPVEIEETSTSLHVEVQSQPQAKGKKRRGCGCVLFMLLLLCSAGALYYWYTSKNLSYQDDMEEHNDIVVNPNLQEALGAEWGNEVLKENITIDSVETQSAPVATIVSEVNDDTVREESDAIVPADTIPVKETNPIVKSRPSVLPIPESLSAKYISDITIADTTDYVIVGTLKTHKLKNGETLIMLALKYYGDKRLWPYIVKYNRIADSNKVSIGMTVNIPELCLVED